MASKKPAKPRLTCPCGAIYKRMPRNRAKKIGFAKVMYCPKCNIF